MISELLGPIRGSTPGNQRSWCRLPTKKRDLPSRGANSSKTTVTKFSSGQVQTTTVKNTWKATFADGWRGTQVTESESHPNFFRRKAGEDVGGSFFSQRRYVESEIPAITLRASRLTSDPKILSEVYSGPFIPSGIPVSNPFPPYIASGANALSAWGAKAIANCKPTNSVADASVFLGELREGLPKLVVHLWKDRTNLAKSAGKDYLNAEFGWKPLYDDMKKFMYAMEHAEEVLRQFERDSGRMVRRRYEFPPEETETVSVIASNVRPYTAITTLTDGTPSSGKVYRVRKTSIRRWFSGAFTYYLPGADEARSVMTHNALLAKQLLGLELTPETAWNLAPWSWAIDWFSSAGDVVSNLTDWATDGLVLRYGYIMEHSSVKDTYIFSGPTGFQQSTVRPSLVTFVSETKQRQKANPFGFGITWDGLTTRQAAIAAALGITKS